MIMQGPSFPKFRRWSVLSLINLVLVSALGILLRYKMAFPLRAINYSFLLQAHSHFAFSGWISTAVFTALVYILSRSGYPIGKAYRFQFLLAQTASFGMLLSCLFEGYGRVSISFSILFIAFSWWFAWQYSKDVGRSGLPIAVKRWAKAALFFFVLSGAGPFLLAYGVFYRSNVHALYYNALYLFLHFQYNGWFSFGVMALFFHTAHAYKMPLNEGNGRLFFRLMAAACIPAYCLSLLWMDPPIWRFVIAAAAAGLQLGALAVLCRMIRSSWAHWSRLLPNQVKLFWGLSFIAFVIKLVLQALSVIPPLGRLAFGFRPMIICYLHLVMLGFLSFFMIGFFIREKLLDPGSGLWKKGWAIFIGGVLLNEVLLLLQALPATKEASWVCAPILLLAAAVIIFGGLLFGLRAQLKVKKS